MLVLCASWPTDSPDSCFEDGIYDLFHKATCGMEIIPFFLFQFSVDINCFVRLCY